MQQLISHLQIICDNVYRENALAVYDHKFQKSLAIYDNVYRQNALVCISQAVLILYYTESHCLASPQASPGLWGPRGGLPRPAPTCPCLFEPIYF